MKRRKPYPAAARSHAQPAKSRRKAPFRVPWVRRCQVEFSDGRSREAFIVNVNEYGAYLADGVMPQQGQGLALRFEKPGSELQLTATGAVAWLNPRQEHPVHSLPAGYAVKFDPLRAELLEVVERAVDDFMRRTGEG